MLYSAQIRASIAEIEARHGTFQEITSKLERLSRRAAKKPPPLTYLPLLTRAARDLRRLVIMLETAERAEEVIKQLYRLP